jgi:2-polyprenyl-3-methyl-5-hydroxy-6-metoxy-1,4-benzoquinol methylase
MDNTMFQPDYLRHEYIYAAHPTSSGWNDAVIDQEILSYVDELLHQAQVVPPASILELGCGMGNLAIPLTCAGFQVMGIDISETAIEVAARRALVAGRGASFRVGNVTSTEAYRDLEVFDCILDGLCWHCIIGQDRQTLLGLVRNALKPAGCFLVMTMCGDPLSSQLITRFDPVSRYITDGHVAERYLGRSQDLEAELSTAGFEVVYRRLVNGNNESGDQNMFLAVARVCQK